MHHYLDFEKPISDLEGKIHELKKIAGEDESIDTSDEVERLEVRAREATVEIYSKLTPWQKTQVAGTINRQSGPALPVYVTGSRPTPFDDGFREQLSTRLNQQGVALATTQVAGELELRFDAQVVRHADGRHEVLISTALLNADTYLLRTADAFDIDPAETPLYHRPAVVKDPGTPVKEWQVMP